MTDPLARRIVLLTTNADGHDLMRQFHKPVDEKRMVVILPPDSYDRWLKATPLQTMEYLRQYFLSVGRKRLHPALPAEFFFVPMYRQCAAGRVHVALWQ